VGAGVGADEGAGLKNELNLSKLTLPNPVTGSQPVSASKPSWQQTRAERFLPAAQLLLPDVMSLVKEEE